MIQKKNLRVPVELKTTDEREIVLPEDSSAYISRVHRLGPGDMFIAFDPEHVLEADAQICRIEHRARVIARLAEIRPATHIARRSITLLQAMSKGDKVDAILRDATELGATCFMPILSERSISRPGHPGTRRERLIRVAVQAARQCGRGDIPKIFSPLSLDQALAEIASNTKQPNPIAFQSFCLDPHASQPLRDHLITLSHTTPIVLAIGPEGGFSEMELNQMERAGFHRTRLGPFVLRTETVCAALLGALLILSPEAPNPSEALS